MCQWTRDAFSPEIDKDQKRLITPKLLARSIQLAINDTEGELKTACERAKAAKSSSRQERAFILGLMLNMSLSMPFGSEKTV